MCPATAAPIQPLSNVMSSASSRGPWSSAWRALRTVRASGVCHKCSVDDGQVGVRCVDFVSLLRALDLAIATVGATRGTLSGLSACAVNRVGLRGWDTSDVHVSHFKPAGGHGSATWLRCRSVPVCHSLREAVLSVDDALTTCAPTKTSSITSALASFDHKWPTFLQYACQAAGTFHARIRQLHDTRGEDAHVSLLHPILHTTHWKCLTT